MGVIKWTTDEVATLLELNAQGVYYREIGERLGRSESAVEMKARALGIKRGSERIRRYKSNTLCWQCINATNSGCNWSRQFEQVDGWTAIEDSIPSCGRDLKTYTVVECPEFEEG